MKPIFFITIILSFFLIFQSCSTNNRVVSNSLFQKRKYNKGWHFNGIKKGEKRKSAEIIKDKITNTNKFVAEKANYSFHKPEQSDITISKLFNKPYSQTNKKFLEQTKRKKIIRNEVFQLGNKIKTIVKVLKPSKKADYYYGPPKRIEKWSLVSFILALVSITLILLLFFYTISPDSIIIILLWALGLLILVLVSFISSLKGLSRYSRYDHYSVSLFFSLFGLIISISILTISILLMMGFL